MWIIYRVNWIAIKKGIESINVPARSYWNGRAGKFGARHLATRYNSLDRCNEAICDASNNCVTMIHIEQLDDQN